MRNRYVLSATVLLCSMGWGQAQNSTSPASQPSTQQSASDQSMPGMDMSGGMSHHDMSNMKDMDDSDASTHVMHSMEGHMDMGPHMKMTTLRQPKSGDTERAQQVAEEARKASEKYLDYHVALADGFRIFHPEVPQQMYHFTNYGYAMEAAFRFNPEHPTSLLYEKQSDGYKLIGVMYTAPKRFTEDQLDERIPLSVAQWHEHVNFCVPPAGMPPAEKKEKMLGPNALFGLKGSIHTQEACDAVGGTFRPIIFNWMVHVYPFEKDPASIWSVERQHGDAD